MERTTPIASPFLSTLLLVLLVSTNCRGFEIKEATIDGIQQAFKEGSLTSRQLVEYYLDQIRALNPLLHAVIEMNPDAVWQADRADRERRSGCHLTGGLHGIPVLLKDNIATRDRLNNTAGSFALLGSVVPRDAGVVRRLRRAGAVILGKASLSEWANFRSLSAPSGWSARGGQGRNPYLLSADPCESSSGSAIAAAANMAAVTLGTETDGSIICPAASNSVVGIKPTVGLTSRAGVIPISPRQDTIGPLCRTVSDAVHVLEEIVGYDPRDEEATQAASKYIPQGGYRQFLKAEGLKGKRLGILRAGFFEFSNRSVRQKTFEKHFNTMREKGAILIDNLEVTNSSIILDYQQSGEMVALLAEFKLSLNAHLSELSYSPVRSLADVIAFNNEHSVEERMEEFGQLIFLAAQNTSGIGPAERSAIAKMTRLSREGLERLMTGKQLDAIVTPDANVAPILAIGGYPGISVPAGYELDETPFGICFGGLKGTDKEECRPPCVEDNHDGQTNISDLIGVPVEQSIVSGNSSEFEEQPHAKAVETSPKRPSSESICSSNILTEDKPEDKPAMDACEIECTSDSFDSSAPSSSTFSGITETSDDGSTSKEPLLSYSAKLGVSSTHASSPGSFTAAVDIGNMNIKVSPSEPASASIPESTVPCSSNSKQNVPTSKTESIDCESSAHSGMTPCSIDTVEGDMNVDHGVGKDNLSYSHACQEHECVELDVESSSQLSKFPGKNDPFCTSSRNEDSLHRAASSEGTAKLEHKEMQTVGTENSSSMASRSNEVLRKSTSSKSFKSASSSAVQSSSDGCGHTIGTVKSLKVDNVPTIPMRSSESRGSIPNGLTTSVKRVVKQFTSPKVSRHYPSEVMLFPYDLFIRLYNYDKVELRPCGLTNCGNSCYANVVLQCLAFTRPLTAYLLEGLHSKTCPKTEWCFTCELERLLMMAKQGKSPLSPAGILSHLSNIGSSFGHGREEDAHEFLRYAIEAMESACLKEVGKNVTGQLVEETTLIQLIFGGYLRSKIRCMRCQGKSERCERMMDLTVEINGDIGTLEEALSRFTATEILDGENKYQCDRCKSYERAKKKLTILEAPNILTIALKRFQSGKFGKLNKCIRFPEYLDLARYMSGTDDKFAVYRLYAVVVHLDIMNASFSGHYVCYVKDTQGKWYKTDDSMVKPVELERVLSKGAYMLLYARCSPRAPSSVRKALFHEQQQRKKMKEKSSPMQLRGSSMAHRRSLFHSQRSMDDAANFQPYDLFDERIRPPNMDSSSDSSSLFSCSSEGSGSTESTRDSVSTDECSEFIFGEPDRMGWNSPLRVSEDLDGFNHSPSSTLRSSDSTSNLGSSGWEADRVEVDRIGHRKQRQDSREGFLEGNMSPPFLYVDPNKQCRKLTGECRTTETDRVNPNEVRPNVLFRRQPKERAAQTFY